jgi:hypothetical protein
VPFVADRASWRPVDLPSTASTGSATGVARLVLLALALAGFVAMHGIAATDLGGTHHNPLLAHVTHVPAHDAVGAAAGSPAEHAGHGVMAGCVFVLLGALAALVLRALYRVRPAAARTGRAPWLPARPPARGPPAPLFITLCVHRV